MSDQMIESKCINWASKNDQLKPANWNQINTSLIQTEHHNLHSTDKMERTSTKEVHITSKSAIFQSGKSDVRLRYCSFEYKAK